VRLATRIRMLERGSEPANRCCADCGMASAGRAAASRVVAGPPMVGGDVGDWAMAGVEVLDTPCASCGRRRCIAIARPLGARLIGRGENAA